MRLVMAPASNPSSERTHSDVSFKPVARSVFAVQSSNRSALPGAAYQSGRSHDLPAIDPNIGSARIANTSPATFATSRIVVARPVPMLNAWP